MAKKGPATATRQVRRSSRRVSAGRDERRSTGLPPVKWGIPLGMMNYAGIGLGVIVIIIGYMLMATGIPDDPANNEGIWNNANAVSVAPILLTIGYCIIIPFAIFFRPKKEAAVLDPDGSANGLES